MDKHTAITFNSVHEINSEYWEELNCRKNVYFNPNFLDAFQTSNPNIVFRYIVVTNNDKAVAFAVVQIIKLGIDVILKNIKITNWLKRVINYLFCESSLNIMFCGNVFLSGEHGMFFKKDTNKNELIKFIADQLKFIAKKERPLHAIFVKDFPKSALPVTNELFRYGYSAMQVEPNMIIELQPEWLTFEDYKNALKSKYRVKVNKADSTSSNLIARLFTESDFATYKDELQQLYENTISNANFNAQVLNLNTYIKLRAEYHEDFIVKAYFIENKLVGFLSALANNNHLDAHFIGLNYELNKTHAIYPRILNDYIRIGIEKKVSHINLGRTASEIKSTIGAFPVDLTCYIRHKRPIMNSIIRPFIKMVKIKDFKMHDPFKTKKEAK